MKRRTSPVFRALPAAFAAIAAALAPVASAPAKTIALWPMEFDTVSGAFSGTNAVGSSHGLSLVNGSSDIGPNWALPSNPDAGGMAFSPLNGGTAALPPGLPGVFRWAGAAVPLAPGETTTLNLP